MLANPRQGDRVIIRYAKAKVARSPSTFPLHGKTGTVEIVGRGKPRNHGILIDGVLYVVPCGNLNRESSQ
jgi:hypothetical protein